MRAERKEWKGIHENLETLLYRTRNAHCLRKSAVWVTPRVNNRPIILKFYFSFVEVTNSKILITKLL